MCEGLERISNKDEHARINEDTQRNQTPVKPNNEELYIVKEISNSPLEAEHSTNKNSPQM